MKSNNLIREKIVKLLRKHPEGLPILEIAELVGAHRHTVTKYVYELIGADVIRIRRIGTAKVCILKNKYIERMKEERILKKLRERVK